MDTTSQKVSPQALAGAVSAPAACSAHSQRIRFLETLDTLTEAERRHLLRIETSDEIASLYTTAVNDYGSDSPAAHTLASVLNARIDTDWPNAEVSEAADKKR